MRDISGIENKELEHILGVEPNSLVEQNQRIVVRYTPCGIVHFGTVKQITKYDEYTQTWLIEDDSGCLIPFDVKQLVNSLRVYNEMKNKDTGPYAITNPCNLFIMGTISNDYQTLNRSEEYSYQLDDGSIVSCYNINADFDAFISTNYKSSRLGDECTFTDIIPFWCKCKYPY